MLLEVFKKQLNSLCLILVRICGCESDFDLDLLSGMQCGVSRGKVMCVSCVRLYFKMLCICIVLYLIEAVFFPFLFIPHLFG